MSHDCFVDCLTCRSIDLSSLSLSPVAGDTRPQNEHFVAYNRAASYTTGRKPYPDKMFVKMREIVGRSHQWVLDIGCGNGRSTIPIRRHWTSRVIGFDYDPEMLEELAHNSLAFGKKIDTVQGMVRDLPAIFSKKRFGAIVAFSAFSHFMSDAAIQAIKSVLAPAGLFIDAGDEGVKNDPMGVIMHKVLARAGMKPEVPPRPQGDQLEAFQKYGGDERRALEANGFEVLKIKVPAPPPDKNKWIEKPATFEFPRPVSYTLSEALAHFKSRITYPRKCTVEEDARIVKELAAFVFETYHKETIDVIVKYRFTVYKVALPINISKL